ncbi:MAG: hypothetical protein SCARUB_01676 [Candidatus Scalindua rubra]|uniref:Uncharacterized protein n=1 Tax=Candidatus Scalindua rubra TaxID=1872076 RepID=A0A1E3XC65_9BACT|nr:MAG: hypothetical protein SCARUB_01676 [Candidatus Scalindua rubra]
MRGKKYKENKGENWGGDRKSEKDDQVGQNVPLERTSEKLEKFYNVDEKTIRRDEKGEMLEGIKPKYVGSIEGTYVPKKIKTLPENITKKQSHQLQEIP